MSSNVVSENECNVDAHQKTVLAGENFEFEAEVPEVMSIIVNNLYSSKDLFLRELISNASDALLKMKASKSDLDQAGYTTDLFSEHQIDVILDKNARTLTIRDNGIGMTYADLKSYLGSVASSGTKNWRKMLDKAKEAGVAEDESLIGQFGLGFYSAFLVADRVDVLTRNVKDRAYLWSSDGIRGYTIQEAEMDGRHGTSVILRLKEGENAYLEANKITELIKKHSGCVRYDIHLFTEEEEVPEKPEGEEIQGDRKSVV